MLALVRPFRLLLVDEPFVGLDPAGREAFVALIDEASGRGATIVIATHQLEYVTRAERCVALRDGAIVYDGAPGAMDVAGLVG
ncbi:MAG: AAA family ATPase [Acidimicrobiales bacterium]